MLFQIQAYSSSLLSYSQTRWTLPDQVPRAMLTAASHDGILLQALLACERYGYIVGKSMEDDNVDILSSSSNTSIIALRQSEGGRQFFAYALAVINSNQHGDKPGATVHNALKTSAAEKKFIPRLCDIQRLLRIIQDAQEIE